MTLLQFLAPLLPCLLLAACAVPVATAPAHGGVAVPVGWAAPVPAGSAELARWWRVFGDPLLVALVDDAIANNTEVAIARANLLQARAERAQGAAALWPQVAGSLLAGRSAPGGGAARNSWQAGFDASWEADLFGASRHGFAAQDEQVAARAAALADTQVSIAAEAAQAYLQLRGTQARIAVARDNLGVQEETLRISGWRRQAGLAHEVEVDQARAAVEQTRSQLPVLQSSATQLAHALGVLTGRVPESLLAQLSEAAALPQARAEIAVAVPAQALAQRPDVAASQRRLRAAAQVLAQAEAARYPALDLRTSVAWTGLTLGSVGSVSAARSLFATLLQPLFDAGARQGRVAQRDAEYRAALSAYQGNVLAALQDVEDALAALAAQRERLAALRLALEAARSAAQLAAQRHAGGLIDFQTVLDTQRTLLGVQDSVASAETELATGHVRLYKALGGGWRREAPEEFS